MTKPKETTELARADEPTGLAASTLAVIARAASDDTVDVDKMERLLEMQKSVMADENRKEANRDLFAFKAEVPQLKKANLIKINGQVRSRYTSFEDMMKQVRPFLTKYGFAERFDTHTDDQGRINGVTCYIVHKSGHEWSSFFPVTADKSGAKNEIQAIGSALSYGKRYAFTAAMGIVTTDEDDDGQSTTQEQIQTGHAAWKGDAPVQDAEVLPPDVSTAEEIAVMIASSGETEKDFNKAIALMTKGKTKDYRDLPKTRQAKLATDAGFKAVIEKIAEIKEQEGRA